MDIWAILVFWSYKKYSYETFLKIYPNVIPSSLGQIRSKEKNFWIINDKLWAMNICLSLFHFC